MSNNIIVTTSELRNKAGELRTQNSSLKAQIDNLQTEESILKGMWEGDASEAFHTAFSNDISQMTEFYNAIQNYCIALENIASQYDNTESANLNIANARKYR